jgi:hypothetical protein
MNNMDIKEKKDEDKMKLLPLQCQNMMQHFEPTFSWEKKASEQTKEDPYKLFPIPKNFKFQQNYVEDLKEIKELNKSILEHIKEERKKCQM